MPAATARNAPTLKATSRGSPPILESAGIYLGSHLSIAGGLPSALREAERLKFSTVQVFTKNQQQWRVPPLDESVVREFRAEQSRLGWNGPPSRTVAHASYLINLASPDDELWAKSINLMHEEIERCERLGIAFLVHHPGSSTTSPKADGINRIVRAYRELFARTRGYRAVSCLENTCGAGNTIGGPFEELAQLRTAIAADTGEPARIGFCIDTCHAHAAGHDLCSAAKVAGTFAAMQSILGLEHIRVFHLNDSKAPCSSRLDRHEHLGKGTIGVAGFTALLAHPALKHRPVIMETPKGKSGSQDWDALNRRRVEKMLSARALTP